MHAAQPLSCCLFDRIQLVQLLPLQEKHGLMHATSQLWQHASIHNNEETLCFRKLANRSTQVSSGRASAYDGAAGLQAAMRDHSWYNESLYDDIMAEFQPLTKQDILVISYGGWYDRFQWDTAQVKSPCPSALISGHKLGYPLTGSGQHEHPSGLASLALVTRLVLSQQAGQPSTDPSSRVCALTPIEAEVCAAVTHIPLTSTTAAPLHLS